MPQVRTPLPEHTEPPIRQHVDSRILLNTGDGKGKSSAAFGVMVRGWTRGWRVAVVQFMKGGKWHSGERELADKLGIDWWTVGDGFTWDSTDLAATAERNAHGWQLAREKLASGDYDLVILDEITYLVNYGWVDAHDVVSGITGRWAKTNVVMTGRNAPPELVDLADTVTEMRVVKHPYADGVRARRGIEY